MKRGWQWVFAAIAFAVALAMPAAAQDRDAVKDWAKKNLIDKSVVIRHFYSGDELIYDADGKLANAAKPGLPDIDGPIHIDDVKFKDDGIEIRGTRQCGTWSGSEYQTVRFKGRDVRLKIAKVPSTPADFLSLVRTIFYADRNDRAADLAEYWQSYIDPLVPPMPSSEGVPLKVGGSVKPPKVEVDPDPSYDEIARAAKLQGIVVMSVVVDKAGHPRSLQIERHFGCGLDERAVLAVSKWRFDPA